MPLKKNKIKYDKTEEPIILSKPLMDLLLKQEKPSDAIALYSFYYYTAKWQKTNQIKCTTDYATNGLKWSKKRTIRAKKILHILGLIQDIQQKNNSGKFEKRYLKINFIWGRTAGLPYYGNNRTTEKDPPNALSNNNKNALSNNNKPGIVRTKLPLGERKQQPKYYAKYVKSFCQIIEEHTKTKINDKNKLQRWRNDFKSLHLEDGVSEERIQKALDWYKGNIGGTYTPQAYTAIGFRRKLPNLERAMSNGRGGKKLKVPELTMGIIAHFPELNDLSYELDEKLTAIRQWYRKAESTIGQSGHYERSQLPSLKHMMTYELPTWLKKQDWIKGSLSAGTFDIQSKVLNKFIKHICVQYGIEKELL